MSIEKLITSDLLYLLQHQYRNGATTSSPCLICGASSCGRGFCAKCICSELERRGVERWKLDSLILLFEQRRKTNHEIALTLDLIQEQMEDKT